MKRVLLGVLLLALALLLLLNVRLHQPGEPSTVRAQLQYLEGALGDGAAEEMQTLFPEGYVFTWSLYGLASARLAGELNPRDAYRRHLLSEARRALAAIRSDTGRSVFEPEMDPPYGVFYTSWSLYVLAEYVRAAGPANLPPAVLQEFTRECDRFALEAGVALVVRSLPRGLRGDRVCAHRLLGSHRSTPARACAPGGIEVAASAIGRRSPDRRPPVSRPRPASGAPAAGSRIPGIMRSGRPRARTRRRGPAP